MVHMMRSVSGRSDPDSASPSSKVKMEVIDNSLADVGGPLCKRPKTLLKSIKEYNPLDEPSPLGLRLRKSPSLLDLIQMRLSQSKSLTPEHQKGERTSFSITKKEGKLSHASGNVDKLKASNFPGSLLQIGSWEYKSKYEGDLVGKCYFAKHKLVWEILDGGLKSKIEIQWSDIMGLNANCPDDEPGTLKVVLARHPLFFRETNPQPRKHTLWQATSDFTNGQASTHRQHFLQCPPGLLTKHFEKLIQCDTRLNFLSRQPEITVTSPWFEQGIDLNSHVEETHAVLEDLRSDDKLLMSKVNNLCRFLPENGEASEHGDSFDEDYEKSMSRKDSFGELLLHLPRITSLPKFFFNISEDGESRAS